MQASFDNCINHANRVSNAPMAGFSYPPEREDWDRIQEPIRVLYVDQKRSLREVHFLLKSRYGFRASQRMIKARLKIWGYLKNATRYDWHCLSRLDHATRQQGGTTSIYLVREHQKTTKDLQRYIRNQGMSSEEFLEEAIRETADQPIPSYIRPLGSGSGEFELPLGQRSPSEFSRKGSDVDVDDQPPGRSFADNMVAPRKPVSYTTSHYSSTASPTMTDNRRRASFDDSSTSLVSPSSLTSDASPPCLQMQREFETCTSQILHAQPLRSRMGTDDIQGWNLFSGDRQVDFLCARCNRPSSEHFVSVDNLRPQSNVQRSILNNSSESTWHLPVSTKEEGSHLWVARCLLACRAFKMGDEQCAETILKDAAQEFKKLLMSKDSSLLTAAGLTITMLHMHDQGSIACRIMQSAATVARQMLPDDNPIKITIEYLAASANAENGQLADSRLTSKHIDFAYQSFCKTLPLTHPYVIAAEYNLSWMLKWEGKFIEAEKHARDVYQRSCEVLTEIHMQSIMSLAVIAGCLVQQGQREEEGVAIYAKVIESADQLLGQSDPYTLEAKRRLAGLLATHLERKWEALQLYKDVVWGRVKMLGPSHQYTVGAVHDYSQMLRQLNQWEYGNGRSSDERIEMEQLMESKKAELGVTANVTLTTNNYLQVNDSERPLWENLSTHKCTQVLRMI